MRGGEEREERCSGTHPPGWMNADRRSRMAAAGTSVCSEVPAHRSQQFNSAEEKRTSEPRTELWSRHFQIFKYLNKNQKYNTVYYNTCNKI